MAFPKDDAERLLADTGRSCCICALSTEFSLHHIIPKESGGANEIDNAIPLCPNCHDEIHASYAPGRTTRLYSADELRLHRQRTIDTIKQEGQWKRGSSVWEADRKLILFFAQCLDRPTFRTHFHQELSFAAFDQAMEDTLIALNTGYWRLRDGTLIARAQGKASIVSKVW